MKINKKKIILIPVIIGGILIFSTFFTFAKYVSNSVWNYYLSAKGFYFSSNYLSVESLKNVNNSWDGKKVNFNLKNSLNKNIVADYDIEYKVTCTVNNSNVSVNCYLNDTTNSTISGTLSNYEACVNNTDDNVIVTSYDKTKCEVNGYEWVKAEALKDLSFELVSTTDEEITNADITIKAESISPYKKTLIGNFVLQKNKNLIGKVNMNYTKKSNYGNLVISNSYNEDKCVTLTWDPSKLLIDDNIDVVNKATDSNGFINEITLKINSKNSVSYKFYQVNPIDNYDISEFKLIEENDC